MDSERNMFETATLLWAGLHGLVTIRSMAHFPLPPIERCLATLLEAHLRPA